MSFVSRYLEPTLVEQLNHLQLSARSVVEGAITGQYRSPVKGASVEFRQHRFYTPGDELRRLDWRVLGRTDRPYIKEYDEETNLRCVLMLDCSGSMAYGERSGTKFDYACQLTAALAYLMLAQTESVGLAMCGARLEQWIAPRAGTAQLSRLIDILERAVPRGQANLPLAMQQVADRLGRRSLVILLTDGFAPVSVLRPGLSRLRHDRHETIVLQVLDRDELDFPFRSWTRFAGLEGETPRIREPAIARRIYLENFARHRQELRDVCRALGVEFHSLVSDKLLIDSITSFLHRRLEQMFFNPLMLVGLGAAVLPLVLHLLSRARYKQVEWGAMMFLQSADSRQRMAARAAQYLLLAARMGIIALLAITLARPVVQGRMARAAPGARVTAALLLDCSASMGYDENGRTRFQMAQAAARQILRGLQSGDRVCLILMGLPQSEAELEPTGDLRAIETRIDEARINYNRANLQESLIRAADVLERYEKSNRDVYVVCDRQALSWKEIDERFAADWRRRLSLAEGATAEQREARMFVFPVGGADADNVSIESIRLAAGPAIHYRRADGTAAPVEVEVAIHNYGNVPRIGLPLTVTVSGVRGSISRSVNLGTNQLTTVNVPIAFERAGSYVVAARLKANGYTGDDHLESVVNVVDPIHVLVIDGDGPGNNFRAAADFLSWALAPRAASGIANGDPFDVTAIAADQWTDRPLQQYGAIILANVDQFSAAQARALEQYVYSGGGLLVAPGSLCRSDDYNAMLYRDGAGILPARLDPPTPSDGSQATTLLSWDVQHPAFGFLRGQFEAPAATVARYFPAKPRQIDATPLAWYLTGDPFLIEGKSERGRVLLMTTALDADWTTMPLSNFYLPFVQSAVRYLASGSVGSANLLPGQPIRLPVFVGPGASDIRLIRPDGRPEKLDIVRVTSQPEVRYGDTEQPGEYQVRIRQGNSDPQIHYFVVRPPREESDLTQLTDDRWKRLENAFGFQLLDPSVRPLRDSMTAGREGREVWAYVLAGVLGLIVLELLIARHWSIPIGGNGRGKEARERGDRAENGDRLDPLEIYASVGDEASEMSRK